MDRESTLKEYDDAAANIDELVLAMSSRASASVTHSVHAAAYVLAHLGQRAVWTREEALRKSGRMSKPLVDAADTLDAGFKQLRSWRHLLRANLGANTPTLRFAKPDAFHEVASWSSAPVFGAVLAPSETMSERIARAAGAVHDALPDVTQTQYSKVLSAGLAIRIVDVQFVKASGMRSMGIEPDDISIRAFEVNATTREQTRVDASPQITLVKPDTFDVLLQLFKPPNHSVLVQLYAMGVLALSIIVDIEEHNPSSGKHFRYYSDEVVFLPRRPFDYDKEDAHLAVCSGLVDDYFNGVRIYNYSHVDSSFNVGTVLHLAYEAAGQPGAHPSNVVTPAPRTGEDTADSKPDALTTFLQQQPATPLHVNFSASRLGAPHVPRKGSMDFEADATEQNWMRLVDPPGGAARRPQVALDSSSSSDSGASVATNNTFADAPPTDRFFERRRAFARRHMPPAPDSDSDDHAELAPSDTETETESGSPQTLQCICYKNGELRGITLSDDLPEVVFERGVVDVEDVKRIQSISTQGPFGIVLFVRGRVLIAVLCGVHRNVVIDEDFLQEPMGTPYRVPMHIFGLLHSETGLRFSVVYLDVRSSQVKGFEIVLTYRPMRVVPRALRFQVRTPTPLDLIQDIFRLDDGSIVLVGQFLRLPSGVHIADLVPYFEFGIRKYAASGELLKRIVVNVYTKECAISVKLRGNKLYILEDYHDDEPQFQIKMCDL